VIVDREVLGVAALHVSSQIDQRIKASEVSVVVFERR
jgi:hypothetical protein